MNYHRNRYLFDLLSRSRNDRRPMSVSGVKAFGADLRQLRDATGMSQQALADELGKLGVAVTGSNVGAWERGLYGPNNAETVNALEAVFEAPGRFAKKLGYGSGEQGPSTDWAVLRRLNLLEQRVAGVEDRLAREERSASRPEKAVGPPEEEVRGYPPKSVLDKLSQTVFVLVGRYLEELRTGASAQRTRRTRRAVEELVRKELASQGASQAEVDDQVAQFMDRLNRIERASKEDDALFALAGADEAALRRENIRLDPPVALGLVEDGDDQPAEEQRFAASEGGRLVQVTDASFKPSGPDVGPDPTLPDEEPDPTVFEPPPDDE